MKRIHLPAAAFAGLVTTGVLALPVTSAFADDDVAMKRSDDDHDVVLVADELTTTVTTTVSTVPPRAPAPGPVEAPAPTATATTTPATRPTTGRATTPAADPEPGPRVIP